MQEYVLVPADNCFIFYNFSKLKYTTLELVKIKMCGFLG